MADTATKPRIIIIGAGFGGLTIARGLRNADVNVLLIDRNNYHTFTPLLYQVSTSGLDSSEIAYPVRTIIRDMKNVNFLLGDVRAIDTAQRLVVVQTETDTREEAYDYLVVATGTTTNFFGNESVAQFSMGMKTLEEAMTIRNHILSLFEQAAWVEDEVTHRAMTTIVVVGGGATGVETAGAIYELYNFVLKNEYRNAREMASRVILVEATDRLLAPYPPNLRESAVKQLESLGVEVRLNTAVQSISEGEVIFANGERIATHTVIWSAGVKGGRIAESLGVPLVRGARIPVTPQLTVAGLEHVYAIGDIAYLEHPVSGEPYPQLIPVAIQQGRLAAKNILAQLRAEPMGEFRYVDKGIMATIGRSRAVVYLFHRIPLTGWIAWVSWLFMHLIWLMGMRNRISVFINWMWNYFTYDRAVRIILNKPMRITAEPEDVPTPEAPPVREL